MIQTPHTILLITTSLLRLRRKTLCHMTIWSKISNTSNVQTIHHLVVRNSITFMRDVQNNNKMKNKIK